MLDVSFIVKIEQITETYRCLKTVLGMPIMAVAN
jgi:hypothetical protein